MVPYGFPDMGDVTVRELEKDGAKAVLLRGHDSQGKEKQMAMTVFAGWETIRVVSSKDTNPDSENSLVIVAGLSEMSCTHMNHSYLSVRFLQRKF